MGLSSLPAPSEGVLCVILVNTALSISIVKAIVSSILHIVGIHLCSSSTPSSEEPLPDFVENNEDTLEFYLSPPDGFIEEFRTRVPATRYDAVCDSNELEQNCSVCLTQFEPDSEINLVCCGHIFHKICLEKWLEYWNITCPNCRSPLVPDKDLNCFW